MIHNRDQLMALENEFLAPYAVKSKDSRGREHEEVEDWTRMPFQKDRDRIIHCRAFRRLKGKTQVFVAHYGDHYRTRLSHSLEVAQVSRDVARSIGLNEDLAESVSLAHDLGHTPFGHAGQDALDELLRPYGLHFEHNEQSKRIVEVLEKVYPHFPGLNLTFEVRQGLMKHQSPWDQVDRQFHGASLEAQVVNLADEIAYSNHDVDDGLRSGLFIEKQLQDLGIWREATKSVMERYGAISNNSIRQGRTVAAMVGLMIQDLIAYTATYLEKMAIDSLEKVYLSKEKLVLFSPQQHQWNRELKEFLEKHMYYHPQVVALSEWGKTILRDLFEYYRAHPHILPEEEQRLIREGARLEEVVKDYLAGMTDGFAEMEWEKIQST